MPVSYSLPKLCDYGGDTSKSWFVWFDIENPDTGATIRKQFRGGINYYKDKEARKREGKALVAYWKKRLDSGLYDPFSTGTSAVNQPGTVTEAITFIVDLKLKTLKKNSRTGYRTISKMLVQWLTDCRLDKLKLYSFTRTQAQAYLDHLLIEKGYNSTTHNSQRSVLHAIFGAMQDRWKNLVPDNPFKISMLPQDIGKNLAYTETEKRTLVAYFKSYAKRMYYAVNFTYHAYLRKPELCDLTVGHIDWESKTIRIDSSGAKNRKQESVTISDGLMLILLEMGLDMAPKNYYIFGKGLETCSSKCPRPNDLTDWHRELKLKAGLPDDGKGYYSWKHTGVIDYFKEIKDIYAVMRQCRHSDLKTTMIYLKSLGLNPNTEFRKAQIYL